MPTQQKPKDGAQNQHYVPKFILRNFLSNENKDQVTVFRKSTGKGFVTSIRNIMAERRFHEFAIGEDYLASFEESICRIEDTLLPAYRYVVEHRRLEHTPESKAALALFVAFQFVRTRQQREKFLELEEQLKGHFEQCGGSIDQLEGYERFTPDSLTEQHIHLIRDGIPDFAEHIVAKDFVLLAAPEGRSFYLGDNPVCLHNAEPPDPLFGNLGLAVEGIEIYMPLTADLMLAAWCPSILKKVKAERERQNRAHKSELIAMLSKGDITPDVMKLQVAHLNELSAATDELIANSSSGTPVTLDASNMDFSNSLQMSCSRDYVICKQGDFRLAERFIKEFPNHSGRKMVTM